MKMLNKWALLLVVALTLILTHTALAQETGAAAAQTVEMADRLRADGKIYVVVGCVLAVLAGMILYLVAIDRKVSRLEKQYKD